MSKMSFLTCLILFFLSELNNVHSSLMQRLLSFLDILKDLEPFVKAMYRKLELFCLSAHLLIFDQL